MVSLFTILSLNNQSKTYNLTIATGSTDGEYYSFAQALSEVIYKNNHKIKINILETEGAKQNIELLKNNQADLALIQSDLSIPSNTKAVAFLFPEMFHLIATDQSKINKVSDLKGKRIALMPEGSGSYNLFWLLSQHYGLKADDFEVIAVPPEQAYTLLNQKKVDALFRVIALGNAGINELLKSGENRLVPIEQAAALQLFQPA